MSSTDARLIGEITTPLAWSKIRVRADAGVDPIKGRVQVMSPLSWVGLILFVCASFWAIVLPHRLVPYRKDLSEGQSPYSGASRLAQVNYMNPNNYTDEGQERLKRLYQVTGLQLLGLVVWFIWF